VEAVMDKPTTSVKEDSSTLYCPTCGKPRDDIKEADEELFKTFYCLNCGKALGVGILLSLKVVCPRCEMLVAVK
jgi:Zn finger protein HypA/HybF involved in hydrogenase expression